MIYLIVILTFISVFTISFLVMGVLMPRDNLIKTRLKALDIILDNNINDELALPFSQRVVMPVSKYLAEYFTRFTPSAIRKMVERKIDMAGGINGLSPDVFLFYWGVMCFVFPAVVFLLAVVLKGKINVIIGLALMAFAFGAFIPLAVLNYKISSRKKHLQRDLPDVLDILTVSVEAGLGFDGALSKLAEKMKGSLVDEFTRMLQEIRVGVSRREALHAMALRCNVADISLFTTSLIQAEQLGVSIGNVLRVQSKAMRDKRRQQAEEKAMKAPIKMMLPLVIFIFPAIFVILLGPAIIQIMEAFISQP